MVGQLETGACLETESLYLDITNTKGMPKAFTLKENYE